MNACRSFLYPRKTNSGATPRQHPVFQRAGHVPPAQPALPDTAPVWESQKGGCRSPATAPSSRAMKAAIVSSVQCQSAAELTSLGSRLRIRCGQSCPRMHETAAQPHVMHDADLAAQFVRLQCAVQAPERLTPVPGTGASKIAEPGSNAGCGCVIHRSGGFQQSHKVNGSSAGMPAASCAIISHSIFPPLHPQGQRGPSRAPARRQQTSSHISSPPAATVRCSDARARTSCRSS